MLTQGTETKPASAPVARPFSEIANLPKAAAGAMRVYLMRHGESIANATGDDPKLTDAQKDKLSEKGGRQAAALGAALKPLAPRKIIHSPAVRARETAEIIAKTVDAKSPPTLNISKAFGPIETGKSATVGKSALQLLVESWKAGVDAKLEGGEDMATVAARVKKGLAEAFAANGDGGPLFIVSHGEVSISVLCDYDLKRTLASLLTFRFANAGMLALDVAKDGTPRVIGYFADVK